MYYGGTLSCLAGLRETMSDRSLDTLLEKLAEGDSLAAEQLFLAYQPYLRMVVRRQFSGSMRAKFDSMDVVQSVWVDLVQGFRDGRWKFESSDHLRAYLTKMARNRFIDRVRQHTPGVQREQVAILDDCETLVETNAGRPSQVAIADELWEQIQAACPPSHREILSLRRDGSGLDEIAERTGFHKSSIRRILYDLARRLALVRQEHQE
jgi:RNA polymerase sigma factor (sigma-70 family)